jgi:hypothetical protein
VFFRGSLYDAATTAYGQVCAPFHSWAIRKAVGAGMYTLPTREQLIERLNETGKQIKMHITSEVQNTWSIFEFLGSGNGFFDCSRIDGHFCRTID